MPIFGLVCLVFLREAVLANADVLANKTISLPIPYIYNLPMKPLAAFGEFFNVTECDEWYMFQFDTNITADDKNFFGHNEGLPMKRPVSSGMLKGGRNILENPCQDVNRSVPYFKELHHSDGLANDVVFSRF